MSHQLNDHTALGILATDGLNNILLVHGTTVPSDGAAGYATGCKFLKTNGGVGTAEYTNEGSITSADFNAVQPGASGGSFSADATFTDDTDISLGTGADALVRWSTGDASDHGVVVALGDTSQMLHITDKAAVASDWAITSPTHPTVYIHSNTTPITDYLAIGAHDGTTAHYNLVGGTTHSFDIAGSAEMLMTATVLSPATSDGMALGSATLMWSDAFLASGGVINFDNGNVTVTHAAGALTFGAGVYVFDQAALDTNILSCRSSDVATGLTTGTTTLDVVTSDFFTVGKFAAATGGAMIQALGENAAVATNLRFESYGGTATTTHTTAGRALIEFYATEHDGSNAAEEVTADGNVFAIRANVGGTEATVWLVDEDGAPQSVVDHAAFDEHDDVALLRSLDVARTGGAYGYIKNKWDGFLKANEDTLVEIGVLGCRMDNPNGERPLMNMKRLAMLQNGAIHQVNSDLMDVCAALYDCIPESAKEKLPARIKSKLVAALEG